MNFWKLEQKIAWIVEREKIYNFKFHAHDDFEKLQSVETPDGTFTAIRYKIVDFFPEFTLFPKWT